MGNIKMALIKKVKLVKPICAITFSKPVNLEKVTAELETILGKVEARSETYAFNYTDYYTREMGIGLRKFFLSFKKLVSPDFLAEIKNKTNAIESSLAVKGKRRINLDPGYVTSAKVVIASAKDFAHRIYLGKGIYGDLQLQYRHGRFWPEKWTFPDYTSQSVIDFFEKVRNQIAQEENL